MQHCAWRIELEALALRTSIETLLCASFKSFLSFIVYCTKPSGSFCDSQTFSSFVVNFDFLYCIYIVNIFVVAFLGVCTVNVLGMYSPARAPFFECSIYFLTIFKRLAEARIAKVMIPYKFKMDSRCIFVVAKIRVFEKVAGTNIILNLYIIIYASNL